MGHSPDGVGKMSALSLAAQRRLTLAGRYVLAALVLTFFVFPIYWLFIISFKTPKWQMRLCVKAQASGRFSKRRTEKSASKPTKTSGKTMVLTMSQPKSVKIRPEEKEPTTIVPKTRKSLKD